MPINKEELAETMGEGNFRNVQVAKVPIVRLNGETGKVVRQDIDENGKYLPPEEIGSDFSGVIIAIRNQLSEFNPSYVRSSNEYDSPKEMLRLWEAQILKGGGAGKRTQIAEGYQGILREKYQMLRSVRWLYMLSKNEVVKFKIRGSGFTNLFEFFKELDKQKLHSFEVVTSIAAKEEFNDKLRKKYFSPELKIRINVTEEQLEMMVAPALKEFHENLAQAKKSFASSIPFTGSEAPVGDEAPQESPEEVPIIDVGDGEELPF